MDYVGSVAIVALFLVGLPFALTADSILRELREKVSRLERRVAALEQKEAREPTVEIWKDFGM